MEKNPNKQILDSGVKAKVDARTALFAKAGCTRVPTQGLIGFQKSKCEFAESFWLVASFHSHTQFKVCPAIAIVVLAMQTC